MAMFDVSLGPLQVMMCCFVSFIFTIDLGYELKGTLTDSIFRMISGIVTFFRLVSSKLG